MYSLNHQTCNNEMKINKNMYSQHLLRNIHDLQENVISHTTKATNAYTHDQVNILIAT